MQGSTGNICEHFASLILAIPATPSLPWEERRHHRIHIILPFQVLNVKHFGLSGFGSRITGLFYHLLNTYKLGILIALVNYYKKFKSIR